MVFLYVFLSVSELSLIQEGYLFKIILCFKTVHQYLDGLFHSSKTGGNLLCLNPFNLSSAYLPLTPIFLLYSVLFDLQ